MTELVIGRIPKAFQSHALSWTQAAKATWIGHRAALVGIGIVSLALAAAITVPAIKVNDAYGWYLAHHCVANSSSSCRTHLALLAHEHTLAYMDGFLALLVPLIAGVFVGAPLLARELESGAFRFTWTQALSRDRFELRRFAVLGVTVVGCACVLGLLMGWFVHPLEALQQNDGWDAALFNSTVLILPVWAFFSLSLGTFLGVAIRRTVPAMAAAALGAGALLVAAGGTRGNLTTRLLGFFPLVARARSWLSTTWSGPATQNHFAPRGSWVVRTFTETPKGKPLSDIFGTTTLWSKILRGSKGRPTVSRWLIAHHYTFWYSYQPASRYWTWEIVLSGILVALGALLVFMTAKLIGRIG